MTLIHKIYTDPSPGAQGTLNYSNTQKHTDTAAHPSAREAHEKTQLQHTGHTQGTHKAHTQGTHTPLRVPIPPLSHCHCGSSRRSQPCAAALRAGPPPPIPPIPSHPIPPIPSRRKGPRARTAARPACPALPQVSSVPALPGSIPGSPQGSRLC